MAKLTQAELDAYKGFLNDLFYSGKLSQRNARKAGNVAFNDYGGFLSEAAKTICNEIKFRQFDLFKVDTALDDLRRQKFYFNLDNKALYGKRTAKQMARIIASFCAEHEIFWDDINTNRTKQEIETYKTSTFGGALRDFGCFLSQRDKQPKTRVVSTSPKVAGQPPKNDYKSRGPQSGNVRDLIGTPGKKLTADGPISFKIEGINTKAQKVKPTVHIKPLDAKGEINGTNKVFIGSANGYTDCTCFFDDVKAADDFLVKCQAICPPHINNLHVVKVKSDPNGYYVVNTEFGQVGISAQKLNEELTEDTAIKSSNNIINIDVYDDAMHRYE